MIIVDENSESESTVKEFNYFLINYNYNIIIVILNYYILQFFKLLYLTVLYKYL